MGVVAVALGAVLAGAVPASAADLLRKDVTRRERGGSLVHRGQAELGGGVRPADRDDAGRGLGDGAADGGLAATGTSPIFKADTGQVVAGSSSRGAARARLRLRRRRPAPGGAGLPAVGRRVERRPERPVVGDRHDQRGDREARARRHAERRARERLLNGLGPGRDRARRRRLRRGGAAQRRGRDQAGREQLHLHGRRAGPRAAGAPASATADRTFAAATRPPGCRAGAPPTGACSTTART